jgi:lipid II:glycine glycyltransferase (peptidoglycan interpeptide bridge formation enzyme)
MSRFKTGFGGKIIHRTGSWDYPLDTTGYAKFRNAETLGMSLSERTEGNRCG